MKNDQVDSKLVMYWFTIAVLSHLLLQLLAINYLHVSWLQATLL